MEAFVPIICVYSKLKKRIESNRFPFFQAILKKAICIAHFDNQEN